MAGDSSLGGSLFKLVLLAGLAVGGVYGVAEIRQLFLNSKVSDQIMRTVIDTISYARVTAKDGRKKLTKVENKLNLQDVKSYITIQTKGDFKGLGAYYLKKSLNGYTNVTVKSARGWRGCNVTDAMPKDSNIKTMTSKSGRKGTSTMMNRVQGIASNDATAVLTGKSAGALPDRAIIYAVDIMFTFKTLFVKRKLWYHHRCYFYPGRRPYTPQNDAKKIADQP